jgi:A/G-specific adenine glycosylase
MDVSKSSIQYFQNQLLDWYKSHGRSFPWRNKSASNYVKIISEVLLQRTKAETVAKYFKTFIEKYPSWRQLGNATQEELEGVLYPLGLQKQRASRLFNLAQEMKKRNGHFPKSKNQVAEMPMMGQYITNAFELFILKKPSPLMDVNMARVLERFFGPRKLADIRYDPYLQQLAQRVINHDEAKILNWAILDFGSITCRYKATKCVICSLNTKCSFNNV